MANEIKGQVGIFIDARTIMVAQARMQGGRMEVLALASMDTPTESVENADVLDPFRVAQAIKSLLKEMNLQPRAVSVALAQQGYWLRTVRLPDVPASERNQLVRNELEETGALPIRSGTVDFLWIPAPSEPGKRMIDAVTYYTNDALVDHMRDALAQAGLQLTRLEPGSISVVRGYLASRPVTEPVAVLSVAQKHSDLCIHDGRAVRSMRRIPSGWADVIAKPNAASPFYTYEEEAEDAATPRQGHSQRDSGLWKLPGETVEPGVSEFRDPVRTASPQPDDFQEPVESVLMRGSFSTDAGFLASEVVRSLAFFAREYPEASKPLYVYVLAPVDVIDKLAPALAANLPLPVKSGDPMAQLQLPRAAQVAHSGIAEGLLPAVGCAIGGDDATLPTLDLSRQLDRVKAGKRAPAVLLAGMAGSTLWMVAAAVASITLTLLESNVRTVDIHIHTETVRLRAERAPLLKRAEINANAKALQAKSQVPASSVLGRVAAATPPGIAVKRLAVGADGKMTIEGDAINTKTMEQFARNLSESAAIKFPAFDTIHQDDKGGLTFRIAGVTRLAPAAAPAGSNPNAQ